jgi:UDP-2-acetamido-3-amino-2,3-dideoxy-glucuronate N-acetyltransferase
MNELFIHPQAICEASRVGKGTRIWAFAHILPDAQIGENCNICDGVFIENDVQIGNEVTIKNGVQVWDGVRLGHRVFVGPNATFTNDRFPRSKQYPEKFAQTTIRDDASIGANATILPGVTIGRGAMVGAGAVVLRDIPARAIVVGNPAQVIGYAGASEAPAEHVPKLPAEFKAKALSLGTHTDRRGKLTVADKSSKPFDAKRYFLVHSVPTGEDRGSHAHRTCHQFLIAAAGQISVALDDGTQAHVVRLCDPGIGIHIPPLIWSMQYAYSADAVLLVACSDSYDRSDYVSDYDEFCRLTRNAA